MLTVNLGNSDDSNVGEHKRHSTQCQLYKNKLHLTSVGYNNTNSTVFLFDSKHLSVLSQYKNRIFNSLSIVVQIFNLLSLK